MKKSNLIKSAIVMLTLTGVVPIKAQSQLETTAALHSNSAVNRSQILKGTFPIVITQSGKVVISETTGASSTINVKMPSLPSLKNFKDKSSGGTGVDGGGGDIKPIPAQELTPEILSNYIKFRAVRNLHYIFNASWDANSDYAYYNLPSMRSTVANMLRLDKKLYSTDSAKNIFSLLSSATIVIQAEACLDPVTGQDKDASANVAENLICLSYDRIKAKVDPKDLDSALTPLLAHEYSHLVGSTEDEAEALEDYFKKLKQIDFDEISKQIENFEDAVVETKIGLFYALSNLKKNFPVGNETQICKSILDLNKVSYEFNGARTGIYQLSILPVNKLYLIEALDMRIQNLVLFCRGTSLDFELKELSEMDPAQIVLSTLWKKNEKQLPLYEAVGRKAEYFDEDYGDVSKWLSSLKNEEKLEKVTKNNRQALRSELNRIIKLLSKLSSQSKHFEVFSPEVMKDLLI